MALLPAILDFVFAPSCLGCDGLIAAGDTARLVCRRCRSRLQPPPAPLCERCGAPLLRTGREPEPDCTECRAWPATLRFARSACVMAPPADRLVHQLKYRSWRDVAGVMAERMAAVPLPPEWRREVARVVPVPTTPARRRQRGYDQAELLARAYAAAARLELCAALVRASAIATQTTLQPAARRANVAGTFRCAADVPAIRAAHVLLVDDVLTTGATAIECAGVLVDAGARCVSVLTFARAIDARRLTTI